MSGPPGNEGRPGQGGSRDITDAHSVTDAGHGIPKAVSIVCPDCAAPALGRDLVHEVTCPLGRQAEATSREDARFFRLHPGRDERWRPVRPDEITMLGLFRAIPDDTEVRGMVGVLRIGDGLRARVFEGRTVVPRGGAR